MITAQDLHRPDRPILFDGGVGTELLRRTIGTDYVPDMANLEYPGHVLDVHSSYVHAGAQVIQTNTFGANAVRLRATGAEVTAPEIIAAACGLATEAARGRALVAGSVGPLGQHIEPYGPLSLEDARAAFAEAIESLISYDIDVILIETMTSLDEAMIALRQALIAGASVVGVSMTFAATPSGPRTALGETPSDVVRKLQDAGVHIAGSNCGPDLDSMTLVARELMSVATVPVLIQASAGIPATDAAGTHVPESPDSFARFSKGLSEIGVRLIGGCCGTGPEHIRQARKLLT